jgi:sterol desaturase/sphingolipid hydroxylase (fatty acid hydroxylase superfamily)
MDTPTVSEDFLKGETNNEIRKKRIKEQQEVIDDRVMNRKMQTTMIMLICILVLVCVLWYRLKLTQCEQPFLAVVFPLAFVALVSFYLFYFIVLDCGIRPADILGITYDMVHPDMINNPIVCVTSS